MPYQKNKQCFYPHLQYTPQGDDKIKCSLDSILFYDPNLNVNVLKDSTKLAW